jgi:ribosomal protein S3
MYLKVQNPYASASIIADSLIEQLEQRYHLEQLLKIFRTNSVAKLEGVKIQISGRLNGQKLPVLNGSVKVVYRFRH